MSIKSFNHNIERKYIRPFVRIVKNLVQLHPSDPTNQQIRQSGITYIDKKNIYKKIKHHKELGVTTNTRSPRLIVSLTSFPERMHDICYCLYSLLSQSCKPDKIILWLAEEQFPDKELNIPSSVLSLCKYGLSIRWCSDIKSYKKYIPTSREYPDDIIVTADDDVYYPEHWLKLLYASYLENPNYIHCHRAHKIKFKNNGEIDLYNNWYKETSDTNPSFSIFYTGVGGVLYPPNSLHMDFQREDLFIKLCPYADDIWFFCMAILKGTKIKIVKNNISNLMYINPERELCLNNEITLSKVNVINHGNDKQLADIMKYYKSLNEKIFFNSHEYWEQRYRKNGNSGSGSYGQLARFKAAIINKFIEDNNINTAIEFGCGDGNQLALLRISRYTGVDVSSTVIEKVKNKFCNDPTKQFVLYGEYQPQTYDISLSLDVIYHLIEDNVFNDYMLKLFSSSSKWVIIYSSNKNEFHDEHVKHRKFTDWIELNMPKWTLKERIPNIYPYSLDDPQNTSFADFYIFHQTNQIVTIIQ